MLVYGNFVALYYLFCVCVILSELRPLFIMSSNEIDNVLEPTAVVDKIKSPTLDHLTCQLAAEVPGDQQQNFLCTSSNIRPTDLERTKKESPYVAMGNAPRNLLTSHRRLK